MVNGISVPSCSCNKSCPLHKNADKSVQTQTSCSIQVKQKSSNDSDPDDYESRYQKHLFVNKSICCDNLSDTDNQISEIIVTKIIRPQSSQKICVHKKLEALKKQNESDSAKPIFAKTKVCANKNPNFSNDQDGNKKLYKSYSFQKIVSKKKSHKQKFEKHCKMKQFRQLLSLLVAKNVQNLVCKYTYIF